jgi:hypothetical protein
MRRLTTRQDACGAAIYDGFHGYNAIEIVERDDGEIAMSGGPRSYLAPLKDWPRHQRRAIRMGLNRAIFGVLMAALAVLWQPPNLSAAAADQPAAAAPGVRPDVQPPRATIERLLASVQVDLETGKDLPIKMKEVTADAAGLYRFQFKGIRFDINEEGKMKALVRVAASVPGPSYSFKVKLETLLEDGRVYASGKQALTEANTRKPGPAAAWEGEMDYDCYNAIPNLASCRLTVTTTEVSDKPDRVEGPIELGRYVLIELAAYVDGRPDLLNCGIIKIEKRLDDNLYAEVYLLQGSHPPSACALAVELMDKEGKPLSRTVQIFGRRPGGPAGNVGSNQAFPFQLGSAAALQAAARFRLSLAACDSPALSAVEADLVMDQRLNHNLVWEIDVPKDFHVENLPWDRRDVNRIGATGIQFQADPQGHLRAFWTMNWYPIAGDNYVVRMEMLSADGKVLKQADVPFATQYDPDFGTEHRPGGRAAWDRNETPLEADLGPRQDLAGAARFRLSAMRAADAGPDRSAALPEKP